MGNLLPLIPVSAAGEGPEPLVISCDDCAFQESDRCADCVVSIVCDLDAGEPLVLDADEERTLRLLSDAGLTPALQLSRRAG